MAPTSDHFLVIAGLDPAIQKTWTLGTSPRVTGREDERGHRV
jgi:hypothetical protein